MNLNKNKLKSKTSIYVALGVLVIVLIVGFITQGKIIEKRNVVLTERGNKYLYLGNYDKAISEYNKINTKKLGESKTLALKNIYIANAYSLKGDSENFKKYIKLAKKSKENDAEILNKIIFYEFINGELRESLKDEEEILKTNPNNKNIIKTMIAVYMNNNELDKAKQLLKTYKVDGNSAYEMAEYSRILMITGDLKGGLQKLKEAWNIDKDEYKIYDVLAQCSIYNKNIIIDNIKDLQDKEASSIVYKMWLAKIYSLSPETSKQGEEILLDLKGKDTGKIQINLIQAAILKNMNKYEEADKLVKEITENNKNDYRIFHTLAWVYLKNNELDKAMTYCKESIKQNSNYPDNYGFLMPEILNDMGKASLAKPYFRTGIEKEPYNYNILENIGSFYHYKEQNVNEALKYYKLASSINRDEPELKYNVALLYFNKGKNSEATEILKKCIKSGKNLKKYHRTLGTVYMTMKNSEEGIKEIRAAYKYDKDDILTLNNAGCYYAIYTNNLQKAYYNLKKSLAGINKNTDEYTKKVIKENYDKVKTMIDKIEKGNVSQSIKVPDFRLLY